MIVILTLIGIDAPSELNVQQIQFRTMESCIQSAQLLKQELTGLNVQAICLDRSAEKPGN